MQEWAQISVIIIVQLEFLFTISQITVIIVYGHQGVLNIIKINLS